MDDQGNAPEATSSEIEAGFGNTTATASDAPMTYKANFDGDEIDGKRYALGDTIDAKVDAGTIAFLVQNGRITPNSPSDDSTSGGEGGKAPAGNDQDSGKDPFEGYDLGEDERAEASQLVKDNQAPALRQIAEDEEVELESDDNKADVAAKIVIARRD